jgi:hypothetical protein
MIAATRKGIELVMPHHFMSPRRTVSHAEKEYLDHPSVKTLIAALGSKHADMGDTLNAAADSSRAEDWFSPQRFLFGMPKHSQPPAPLAVAREYACVSHICWHAYLNRQFATKDAQDMRTCVCSALTNACLDEDKIQHGSPLCEAVRKAYQAGEVDQCPEPGEEGDGKWKTAISWAEVQGEYYEGQKNNILGGFGSQALPDVCRNFVMPEAA